MQNKPNLLNAQINITLYNTRGYRNVPLRRRWQNKANSKPIQSQSNPIKPNQTQFQTTCAENKPNRTQYFALFVLPMLPIHPNQTQF